MGASCRTWPGVVPVTEYNSGVLLVRKVNRGGVLTGAAFPGKPRGAGRQARAGAGWAALRSDFAPA
jgi:hypothetical protein